MWSVADKRPASSVLAFPPCGVHPCLAMGPYDVAMSLRRRTGTRAHAFGLKAEDAACAALAREGWTVLGRRVRTEAGELDVLAEQDGVLAVIEVKARPDACRCRNSIDAPSAGTIARWPPKSFWRRIPPGASTACASTCWSSMPSVRCDASPMHSGLNVSRAACDAADSVWAVRRWAPCAPVDRTDPACVHARPRSGRPLPPVRTNSHSAAIAGCRR